MLLEGSFYEDQILEMNRGFDTRDRWGVFLPSHVLFHYLVDEFEKP